jgi:hypothetical protein
MSKGPRMLQTSGKKHVTIDLFVCSTIKEHERSTKELLGLGLLLHSDIDHLVKHQQPNSTSSLWGFAHCQT